MIEKLIVIALTTQAIHAAFQDGMIFGGYGAKVEALNESLYKLLFGCPTCMAFWYGTFITIYMGWDWKLIFPAMGLNWVIGKLYPYEPS